VANKISDEHMASSWHFAVRVMSREPQTDGHGSTD
jgi:hypothetical protein